MVLRAAILFISVLTNLQPTSQQWPRNLEINQISANYNETVTVTTDKRVYHVIVFPMSSSIFPFRVSVWSKFPKNSVPVLVVVRQQEDVLSWQLPLLVSSMSGTVKFYQTSRTLCHNYLYKMDKNRAVTQNFMIGITTSSNVSLKVNAVMKEDKNFFVISNHDYWVKITPAKPRYVYYRFLHEKDETGTVVIDINSEDDVCLTVSVQSSTCPVFDLNKDITYQGKYQTVNRKGGMTITEEEFPDGFFLVFVAQGDNYECSNKFSRYTGQGSVVPFPINRKTEVRFIIRPSIKSKDYLRAYLTTIAVIVAFCAFSVSIACIFYKCGTMASLLARNQDLESVNKTIIEYETEEDEIDSIIKSKAVYVNQLAMQLNIGKKRSYKFLLHTLNIALFYSIPVVQLAIINQKLLNISGNQDNCYYNFLCSHPAFGFSDFNHIFSNIGYVSMGVLFLILVLYRQTNFHVKEGYGIPKHYGLYYAMGVALIIEGLLSGCYHICPSQANYQFDTSFMYVMAILCILKLYENRHPDIKATAYATFSVLGVAIFTAMIGILNATVLFWGFFVPFYIMFITFLTFKVYYFNYMFRGIELFVREVREKRSSLSTWTPLKKDRFYMLLIINVLNYAMVIMGCIYCLKDVIDFGTFLLAVLMGNSVVYAVGYAMMKWHHKETVCVEAGIFIILALIAWSASAYFFVDYAALWTVTPAESRKNNQLCIWMNFYDHHDIWHLLSASALFFTFMFLFVLDDDLVSTPQENIAVF